MKNIFVFLTRNQSLLYKVFLYVVSTVLVIYLFPKGGQFKYNFQKGKLWQYENLYAPFNFTIKKDKETIEAEKESIKAAAIPYFDVNTQIPKEVEKAFLSKLDTYYVDSLYTTSKNRITEIGQGIIHTVYHQGLVASAEAFSKGKVVYLKSGNEVSEEVLSTFFQKDDLPNLLLERTQNRKDILPLLERIIPSVVIANITYNPQLTDAGIENAVAQINPNEGVVEKGARIIGKGEVVEGAKFQMLNSLRDQFQSKVWSHNNYYWLVLGYSILVSLVFVMLFLFLKKYRKEIYDNNTKVSFIFFNIVVMVFMTTFVVKYNASYVYVIPLCILPIIIKSFFDARLGLFAHVLTILLLGFIVPNSFEFMFLQIIAGIVTILTVSELYKRANLFISVGQITFIYILGYFAFYIIQEGNISDIEVKNFGYFIICGLVTLFAFPLIYIYEKVFGLVSEVSLLELSNTNSALLKELSNKAPGTFHHSLNVANLAEAAANEIGANSMLARVGALYHDIGKMNNPSNFTENQLNLINPLNELAPKESAKIIIDHVIKGIEIARKNKLPDRIVDFIRTHHGTSLVYYFYKLEKEANIDVNPEDFRYPGPKPFSKETAILMMADSVEAASKSLKEPTSVKIDSFVENIINGQMEQGQFINANITFKEIEIIKKILKKKLKNSYHLRVEYPE
ncbi:MAG: HDIG domain-containing protein [Flavobacteriaceae bacterium]